jgi:hypothetical protein
MPAGVLQITRVTVAGERAWMVITITQIPWSGGKGKLHNKAMKNRFKKRNSHRGNTQE